MVFGNIAGKLLFDIAQLPVPAKDAAADIDRTRSVKVKRSVAAADIAGGLKKGGVEEAVVGGWDEGWAS